MSRFRLCACALFYFVGAACAQTLAGQIVDGETGEPLPGATVLLPTLDLGAVSDVDGRYAIDVLASGSFRIIFSFVGYKSETRSIDIAADETVALDVILTPSFVEVGNVTVSAKARESDILSTPQSLAVVDADVIARSAGGTPMDALEGVAGVRLLRTGPAVAKPVIRGLTAQRVLVVADGVRQEGQQWGDEHGPEIGSADVDRIEVVRGPSSLLYGSDALGGVVHTSHDDLFRYSSTLAGSAQLVGLSGTRHGASNFTIGGLSGRWAYEGRLGLLKAGYVDTPNGPILNTAQEQYTGSARLGTSVGANGRIVLDAGTFRSRLGLFEPDLAGLEDQAAPLGRYEFAEPFQRIAHDRAGIRAEIPLDRNRFEISTSVQQNRRQEFEEGGGEDPSLFLRLTTGTADARMHHRPIGKIFGTVGASGMWQRNETLGEETLIPSATTWNGSVYVTEELVLPSVTLDAGIRLDKRSVDVAANESLDVLAQVRNYTAVTGAVGVAWQPRGDLSLAANLGRAFRAPQLIELFGNGVHEGTLRFERGDSDLASETSLAVDGVVRYLTPHVYAEISGFVNQIGSYIFPRSTGEVDPESGLFVFEYAQADARLYGGEFRVDVHPHSFHGLGLHFSGDITEGSNREIGLPLPFVPPAQLRVAVEFKAEDLGPADDLELRLGPAFTASQDRPGLPDEIQTAGFAVWDISIDATLSGRGMTFSPALAIDNLFNRAYVDPMSRYRPYGLLSPGRSVRVALRVGFGG